VISVCSDNPWVPSWTEVPGPLLSFSDQVEEKVQVLFFCSVVLPESNHVSYTNQTVYPRPLTVYLEWQVPGSWQHLGIWTLVVSAGLHASAESGQGARGGVDFLDAALIDGPPRQKVPSPALPNKIQMTRSQFSIEKQSCLETDLLPESSQGH